MRDNRNNLVLLASLVILFPFVHFFLLGLFPLVRSSFHSSLIHSNNPKWKSEHVERMKRRDGMVRAER